MCGEPWAVSKRTNNIDSPKSDGQGLFYSAIRNNFGDN